MFGQKGQKNKPYYTVEVFGNSTRNHQPKQQVDGHKYLSKNY